VPQAGGPAEEELGEEAFYEDDDDLGYYKDGVKRMLTNEQIKIFRHSEIHTLLRERQRLREEEEEEEEEYDPEKPHGSAADSQAKPKIDSSSSHPDSGNLAATQKRKSIEGNESRGVIADKKRPRHGAYGDHNSNKSLMTDNEAVKNVHENTSSQDFNSVRRIVSYADD
jgi:Protein of unknown function (DUF3807)